MATLAAAALLAATACDFKVTNPGPIQAADLDKASAVPALVSGAGRDLAEALNWVGYTGGAVAREVFPGGSTGTFGITVLWQLGKLVPEETSTHWNLAQRARWTAEHGVDRLRTLLGTNFAKSKDAAQMLLWAGYADRLLGENMCEAVIDGGGRQPYTVFLTRAEGYFTEAAAVAAAVGDSTLARAARAGRASVRADLGNWTGAAADAATIPDAFAYRMPYYTIELDQYNRIYWASASSPYRAHTVYRTYYESYYRTVKDPRVSWDSAIVNGKVQVGDAAVTIEGLNGRVPWYFQTKYKTRDAAINLSSGWEMRLIEAEAALVTSGDINKAMPLINKHRLALGLPAWTGATLDEAWQRLKRERGIELWLEGRRLGDLRRWAAANRPGTADDMTGRDLCFPISRSEKETNKNLAGG
jgi:hypothetical protein